MGAIFGLFHLTILWFLKIDFAWYSFWKLNSNKDWTLEFIVWRKEKETKTIEDETIVFIVNDPFSLFLFFVFPFFLPFSFFMFKGWYWSVVKKRIFFCKFSYIISLVVVLFIHPSYHPSIQVPHPGRKRWWKKTTTTTNGGSSSLSKCLRDFSLVKINCY